MFILWIGFIFFIGLLLALDLGLFHKKDHLINPKEALSWTAFWIGLALLFVLFIYTAYQNHWFGVGLYDNKSINGTEAALKYVTGYIIEKSLSLDNIFVIAVIFTFFNVPPIYHHRVLFWGIIGAIIMRGFMITLGVSLIQKFSWMVYVFGILLIITSLRMLLERRDKLDPNKNYLLKLTHRFFHVSNEFHGDHFFIKKEGKHAVSQLFLVLLIIESTDVFFAIDSIPAIFAITTDPFLVFTSNVFAILGLRSLYFAVAIMMQKFRYLKVSLFLILAFVGIKMILTHHYHIPTLISLGTILGIISSGIIASLITENRHV